MSHIKRLLSDGPTAVLALAAIAVAAIAWRNSAAGSSKVVLKPTPTPEWAELVRIATWPAGISSSMARRTSAIVFVGIGCRLCDSVLRAIDSVGRARRASYSVGFVHFPQPASYPGSFTVSIGAECAYQQGKLIEYLHLSFAAQNSKELVSGASQALGIDKQRFDSCMVDPDRAQVVERHIVAARQVGIRSLPSAMINGFLVRDPLASGAIDSTWSLADTEKRQ